MKLQRWDGRQGIYQGQWCMDEEVTEPGIFKGLADSIWIMGAQFGWECCEANDKDRLNHAINTQDFPIAVQVPLKAPEV